MTETQFKEQFKILPIEDIISSRTNPRKEYNQIKLNELADSIKSNGVIQPVIVRKNGKPENKFELVSGERRLKASIFAGMETIPAIIKNLTDEQCWEIQIIENLQRVDIHPLHEAEGFKRVIDTGKYTKELLAAKVGKSRSYITQRIKLNDLTVEAKKKFYEGKILLGHALVIAKLQERDQHEVLKWNLLLTPVDKMDDMVKTKFLSKLENAPFDLNDLNLMPEMGNCKSCHLRSGFDTNLFPELTEDDHCTYRKCYDEKVSAHIDNEIRVAESEGKELVKISNFYRSGDDRVLGQHQYSLVDDDYELEENEETKDAIWVDGLHRGFKTYIAVVKKSEIDIEDDKDEDENEETSVENKLSANNRAVADKRLQKTADYLIIGILQKYNLLREFTLEALKEIAQLFIFNSDVDIETTAAYSLKLISDEEEEFNLSLYINETDDPKMVKDIIMHLMLYNLASNPYSSEFETLKRIAVEEYDLDLTKIEEQVNKELPFEEEKKEVSSK